MIYTIKIILPSPHTAHAGGRTGNNWLNLDNLTTQTNRASAQRRLLCGEKTPAKHPCRYVYYTHSVAMFRLSKAKRFYLDYSPSESVQP